MSVAYLNGAYLPLADARISPLDRGFLFADGIYEVAAVIDGKLVDSASHLARLERSTSAIGIRLPLPLAEIEAVQKELVVRNGLSEGLVYLQITRGADRTRDFIAPEGLAPTLFLFVQAKPFLDVPAVRDGIAVATMPDLRWTRRDIKSVGLLAQAMGKQAARAAGAQEAWMVEDGFVTEGASSTAFILTEDGIVTRPYSQAVLAGCTGERWLRWRRKAASPWCAAPSPSPKHWTPRKRSSPARRPCASRWCGSTVRRSATERPAPSPCACGNSISTLPGKPGFDGKDSETEGRSTALSKIGSL